jgi:hypothetical protein
MTKEIVETGERPSRSAAVEKTLARERRQASAVHDAAVLATAGLDPELAGMAEFAAGLAPTD